MSDQPVDQSGREGEIAALRGEVHAIRIEMQELEKRLIREIDQVFGAMVEQIGMMVEGRAAPASPTRLQN